MSKGLGKIQKRILEVLDRIDSRWCSRKDFAQRWVSLNIMILAVYNKPLNPRARLGKDYNKNEHRRIWESVRMLEKRGLVHTRIEKIKGSGVEARKGGIQLWLEVRVV
ncbi:MAG: hypothetical protein AMJ73_10245 [candidate division Zixibacteria bacterium SM1_73]|nr:MAG: hypothetical protein AMJ73_10245 [candidate division Zixibacteria bacterium SM1_73]